MRPATRTLGRLAALATAVVGFAVAPATAGATPEALDCTVSPRPAPICGVESTVPIAHGRAGLAETGGQATEVGAGDEGTGRPAPGLGVVCTSGPEPCVDPTHAALLWRRDAAPIAREVEGGFEPHRRGDLAVTSDADAGREARPAPLASPVETPHGFDWTDAAVGAAVALGAALLLAAGWAVRRHGRPEMPGTVRADTDFGA